MSDLPAGWEWTTLGEVLDGIEAGRSFGGPARPASDGEWGIIKVSAMTSGRFRAGENKAAPADLKVDAGHVIKSGDLLLSRANTESLVGATALVGEIGGNLLLSDKSLRLVPSAAVDVRYLAAFLGSPAVRKVISARATGTKDSMRNISQSMLRALEVPLPPLAEQRRIEARVEALMDCLEEARRSLERAQVRSRALVLTYRDEALASAAQESESVQLRTLLREPMRNGYSGRETALSSGIRTLTLTAVTRGDLSDRYTKMADVGERNVGDLWLQPGDVLVQRANTAELVGTSAVYSGPPNWAIFPDLMIRVRADDQVDAEYLQMVLAGSAARDAMRRAAKGLSGSMPKIDQATLGNLMIPRPGISEQRQAVDKFAELRASVERLRASCAEGQLRLQTLRRSVLADAFAGRLVPREPTDEPASVLLDRIRAERPQVIRRRSARR